MLISVFLKSSLALVFKIDKRPRVDLRLKGQGRKSLPGFGGDLLLSRRSSLAEPVVLAGGAQRLQRQPTCLLRGYEQCFFCL